MKNSQLQIFKESIASITDADALTAALQTEQQTSIRINPKKMEAPALSKIPWNQYGYYLETRPLFTLDPLFHAGAYYVQEASSMFLEQIISPLASGPLRVLDLCAAPGGKSTLTASLVPEGSLLVANEVIRSRAQILSENLIKWGQNNCIVTNNDPKDFSFLRGFFDLIIVDAPCSGEGMFRKDANAVEEWSPENVDLCCKRQLRILYDIWDCLTPGGTIIYSTCTFNERENEDVVARIISEKEASCKRVNFDAAWNITEREKNGAISYRFFPHLTKGEGFSKSVIQKNDGSEFSLPKKTNPPRCYTQISDKNAQSYQSLFQGDMQFLQDKKNELWAFPKSLYPLLAHIASNCTIVHAGTPVAEVMGNKRNPLPGLAFALNYNKDAFPSVAIDLETAVRYFKKEPLSLPDAPKGWVHLTYNGISMGFVKNIGNRANNPYPSEWAIKMTICYSKIQKVF